MSMRVIPGRVASCKLYLVKGILHQGYIFGGGIPRSSSLQVFGPFEAKIFSIVQVTGYPIEEKL